MKKNIAFLCYSRYVIFVAYILKNTVYKNDEVSLIIPDSTANYNGLVEQMEKSKCWDKVIPFQELDDVENVKHRVKAFIAENVIDVFCVAHIMRCASHFFTEYLPDSTEINMFDEGCITLDFIGEYKNYCTHGLKEGWVNFHFERVSNIYSFFPTITKPFYKAEVKGINLEYVVNKGFVQELNHMFEYKYQRQNIETIVVDSNSAACGFYSTAYEQFCIDNILENIDCSKCYIKKKPSEKESVLRAKYGKYNVQYIKGGMVPFEILYLNMFFHHDLPQLIICTNSSAVWTIGYLNMMLKQKVDIVVLIDIMKEYFWDINFKKSTENMLQMYNRCFENEYKIIIPKTWKELYQFMCKFSFFTQPDLDSIKDRELEWLKKDYIKKCNLELHFYRPRFKEAYNWILNVSTGKKLEEKLIERNIDEIVVYGIGDFAKMFLCSIAKSSVKIKCFVVSNKTRQNTFNDIPLFSLKEFMENENVNKLPVLISAVGSEEEIKDALKENNYMGEIILISDLF